MGITTEQQKQWLQEENYRASIARLLRIRRPCWLFNCWPQPCNCNKIERTNVFCSVYVLKEFIWPVKSHLFITGVIIKNPLLYSLNKLYSHFCCLLANYNPIIYFNEWYKCWLFIGINDRLRDIYLRNQSSVSQEYLDTPKIQVLGVIILKTTEVPKQIVLHLKLDCWESIK